MLNNSLVVHDNLSLPKNPHSKSSSSNNEGQETLKATNIEDYTFNEQFNSYQRAGYAIDASSNEVLGDQEAHAKDLNTTRNDSKKKKKEKKDKRKQIELEEEDYDESLGPWATEKKIDPVVAEMSKPDTKIAKIERAEETVKTAEELEEDLENKHIYIVEPDEEDEMWEKKNERKLTSILPPRPKRGSVISDSKTTFHGASLVDYQGRAWCAAPSNIKPEEFQGDHDCYLPKKCIKKFIGHTKGVQAIEFFPKTGHLLLSASMDGKAKIWDCTTDFNVRRTYIGHDLGIRSMNMNLDGSQFLTAAFDRYVRLWDVETGKAAATITNRKMFYDVKFSPRDQHMFLAAASDNKVYQWDTRTGQIAQEYNYHLQPCNTVTFFDEGRKFISTSDDKKVLVWDVGIPVPTKYIAEPDMHVIPSVTPHPTQDYLACQSMDNKILVYQAGEKVKPVKKKTFLGHNNSGYACKIGFSPNGKFIMSGDGHGQVHFWDWKTCKSYRKLQAHDNGPCMSTAWHPLKPSWVATCGWDGLIKLWD